MTGTCFLLLGLVNNMPYVILLATAKSVSEGGTAVVYLVNTAPGLLVKISAPYWYDRVSYRVRLRVAALLLAVALSVTAWFAHAQQQSQQQHTMDNNRASDTDEDTTATLSTAFWGQLCGVALVSVQIGLGESTLLALAGKLDAAAARDNNESSSSSLAYAPVLQESSLEVEEETVGTLWPSYTGTGDTNDNNSNNNQKNQNCLHEFDENAIDHVDSAASAPTPRPSANASSSRCLLSFASGTGMAGPMGYLWKVAWTEWMGRSVADMLIRATVLAVVYATASELAMGPGNMDAPNEEMNAHRYSTVCAATQDRLASKSNYNALNPIANNESDKAICDFEHGQEMVPIRDSVQATNAAHMTAAGHRDRNCATNYLSVAHVPMEPRVPPVHTMSFHERLGLVRSLWPYAIPLCTVYAAEYACQAGAWTAIGFPRANSVEARANFYVRSNWLYQIGSLVSRSSGGFCTVSLAGLWIMPLLQIINLVFFTVTAAWPGSFWYQPSILLGGSFYTGLLGGAVYVHGYQRIVADLPTEYTEFALATTCVAEAIGVLMADILGLFLQSCLYAFNDISGAMVQCPM